MNIITSKSNNVIKKTKKLHQKKYRKTSYLIEGWHLFEEAKANGARFLQIFVTEEHLDRVGDFSQLTLVSSEVLACLSDSKTPQGIVAEVAMEVEPPKASLSGRYLYLEEVQDPGNVGTMIRTADAAGFDGVFLSQGSADLYSLKTLRSMQGSHFHIPVWRMEPSELFRLAKQSQVEVLASTLAKDSIDHRQLDPASSFILVMGNEGQGISPMMTENADRLVHIAMSGQAESLNVAVAAGILMFALR